MNLRELRKLREQMTSIAWVSPLRLIRRELDWRRRGEFDMPAWGSFRPEAVSNSAPCPAAARPGPPLARAVRPSHTLSGLFAMLAGRRELDTISATTLPAFQSAYERCEMLDRVNGEEYWRMMRHIIKEVTK